MLRVTTEWTGSVAGTPYYSTHHFTGETSTEAAAVTTAVATFWTSLGVHISTQLTWRVLDDVEVVDPITGAVTGLADGVSTSDTGDSIQQLLPLTTQGLIRWRTGIFSDGREIRGRTFVPGLVEPVSDQGAPTAEVIQTMSNAAIALIDDASVELLVWRRPREAQADPPLPARPGSTAIAGFSNVWSQWAVLRSRRD